VGYSGHDVPWDGAFIDCVARDAGLAGLPSLVSTTAGLGELLARRRAASRPRRGDVVFFSFSTAPARFAGPHVGVVADGSRFRTTGAFTAVEAQVASGSPRAPDVADGIFVRRRSVHDVLAFCRPLLFDAARPGSTPVQTGASITLRELSLTRPSSDTRLVQSALNAGLLKRRRADGHARSVGPGLLEALRADGHAAVPVTGVWDARTRAAFARFQRSVGFVGPDASGDPEPAALARLGRDSGLWSSVS
jgi:hypothetical protein